MHQQQPNEALPISVTRQYHPGFKAGIVALIAVAFILYRLLFPQPNVGCIYDAYQTATLPANRQLVEDPSLPAYEGNSNQLSVAGMAFIGTGQVIMDLWIGIFGVIWLVKVKNLRGMGALAGFFLTRAVIFLNIQKFPYPDNLAWRSPGFFSFTVPYDHTRDFFYSGHTGTLTAIFLELVLLELPLPSVLSFLCLLFMMNMLLITQVHYVCDIIGGLVFATWFHRTATRVVYYMDKLLSLPFFVGKWLYENKCKPLCESEEKGQASTQSNEGDGNQNRERKSQIKVEENKDGKKEEHRYESIQIESRKSLEGMHN